MTNKKLLRLLLIVVLVSMAGGAYFFIQKGSPVSDKNGTSFMVPEGKNFSARIVQIDSNAWGYEILVDTLPFIYQPFIPGIPGNQSFQSAGEAQKCSELVLLKLQKKQIPSLSRKEIDNLGIRYQ